MICQFLPHKKTTTNHNAEQSKKQSCLWISTLNSLSLCMIYRKESFDSSLNGVFDSMKRETHRPKRKPWTTKKINTCNTVNQHRNLNLITRSKIYSRLKRKQTKTTGTKRRFVEIIPLSPSSPKIPNFCCRGSQRESFHLWRSGLFIVWFHHHLGLGIVVESTYHYHNNNN